MTRISTRHTPPIAIVGFAVLMLSACGCTALNVPSLPLVSGPSMETDYRGADGAFQLQTSIAEQTYHSVRRARSENAIVLQVVGDDSPNRVLPLPSEGKTVYVSNLLEQTGVLKKLGFVEATLFRHTSDSIGGMPMVVKMSRDGQSVKPESDYALQAGDRLKVQKATNPALQGLVNTMLGL